MFQFFKTNLPTVIFAQNRHAAIPENLLKPFFIASWLMFDSIGGRRFVAFVIDFVAFVIQFVAFVIHFFS